LAWLFYRIDSSSISSTSVGWARTCAVFLFVAVIVAGHIYAKRFFVQPLIDLVPLI